MITPVRPFSAPKGVSSTRRSGAAAQGDNFSAGAAASSESASPPRGVVSAPSVASMDAVMALQGVDDPAGRRARAVRRGERLLDDLDDLKLGFLEGRLSETKLESLLATVSSSRDETGQDGLDDVLDGIELRARVELAKLGR